MNTREDKGMVARWNEQPESVYAEVFLLAILMRASRATENEMPEGVLILTRTGSSRPSMAKGVPTAGGLWPGEFAS